MPTTRRKPQADRAQPTLSFNSRAAKITKPSTSTSKFAKSVKAPRASDAVSIPSPLAEDVIESDREEGETSRKLAIREEKIEVKETKKEEKSSDEERARAISDAQVRRYWKGKEEGRKAPRGMQLWVKASVGG